jgi:ubiquinone/menaquinone biosynthesis C-methylase UbiE
MSEKRANCENRSRKDEKAWFDHTAGHWEGQYGYQGLRGRLVHKRMELALQYLQGQHLAPNTKVLDLGCGPGIVAKQLAILGFRTYAVDLSGDSLARARRRLDDDCLPPTHLAQADAHRLPFKDNAFDAVFAIAIVVWAADPAQVLREITRVLRPGGILIVTARNKFSIENVFDPFFWASRLVPKKIRTRLRGLFKRHNGQQQKRLEPKQISIRRFDKMLKNVQLEKMEWRTLQYGPLKLMRRSILPTRLQVAIDKALDRIWWAPGIRRLGWTYCVKAIRTIQRPNE